MRTTIRQGSFETNSSSTHSLTMLTPQEYAELRNPGTFLSNTNSFNLEPGRIYTVSEFEAMGWDEDEIQELVHDNALFTVDNYWGYPDDDREINKLTTPGGEDIVIICDYGKHY